MGEGGRNYDATPLLVGIFCTLAVAAVLGIGAYLGLRLLKDAKPPSVPRSSFQTSLADTELTPRFHLEES
jgi:hypothetical protein